MANPDILYDGEHVFWYGMGNYKKAEYEASSGLKGYQTADKQDIKDKGPIPAGEYWFSLAIAGTAHVVNTQPGHFTLDSKQGIQSLVNMEDDEGETHNSSAWGKNRVRLNVTKMTNGDAQRAHRDGFYLHDSVKGFSHGCIEVDTAFFKRLRMFAAEEAKKKGGRDKLVLHVKYPSLMASTQGSTLQKLLEAE